MQAHGNTKKNKTRAPDYSLGSESRLSHEPSKHTKSCDFARSNDKIRPRNASSVSGSRNRTADKNIETVSREGNKNPESHATARSRREKAKQLQWGNVNNCPCLPSQPQGCPELQDMCPDSHVAQTGEDLPPQSEARVFVLAKNKKPLMPCSPRTARILLKNKEALVVNLKPFTIRLKKSTTTYKQPIQLKLDPGAKYTGIALITNDKPVLLAEIEHKKDIKSNLKSRSACRRRRRSCNLRYRPARFDNRTRTKFKQGWLAPSLRNLLETTDSWVKKLIKITPITGINQELVKFDMQKMENANISGKQYQQGTLFEKEVWEYLLERDGRKCVYCGAENVKLEKDHVIPKVRGGSNKISNLVVACRDCNENKGSQRIEDFLKNKPKILQKVRSQLKKNLSSAAAVNTTRKALLNNLRKTGLPVETSTGARTKYNRKLFKIPKYHCLDALCVGEIYKIYNWNIPILKIKCIGRGSHQVVMTDSYGFPRTKLGPEQPKRDSKGNVIGIKTNKNDKPVRTKLELNKVKGLKGKRPFGFATGDIVKCISDGKIGRVAAAKSSGTVVVRVPGEEKDRNITYKKVKLISRANGYDCWYENLTQV